MLRNILAAALRNMARHKLYAAINLIGLAVGFTAAILIGTVVRNQLTFDRFVDGYHRTYLVVSVAELPGRATRFFATTDRTFAAFFASRFPEVAAATRLLNEDVGFRRGEIEGNETIYWADANAFAVLPLPVLAGDLETALARPDGIVLTRTAARRYFGRDDPLDESLDLNIRTRRGEAPSTHPMRVAAVVEDLPVNGTHLVTGIFASGSAAFSLLDAAQRPQTGINFAVRTYLRLAGPNSVETLNAALPAVKLELVGPSARAREHWANNGLLPVELVRLDEIHLFAGLNPGMEARLAIAAVVSLLVLFIACVNFVNLATAHSARRAAEVGIRKVSGAARRTLVAQFLGESIAQIAVATVVALALAELLLPTVNAALATGATLDLARDWRLLAVLTLGVLAVGTLAGLYPAFVLSSFRPVRVFGGRLAHAPGGSPLRQGLVAVQFAILIALVIAAITVFRQQRFATEDALRVDSDQVLIIRTRNVLSCEGALVTEIRALQGVRAVSCSTLPDNAPSLVGRGPDGEVIQTGLVFVSAGFFELYGLMPLAGRLDLPEGSGAGARVINETAMRQFGYASPEAAIGQIVRGRGGDFLVHGVVRDFSLGSVDMPVIPILYFWDSPGAFGLSIHAKLMGREIPETLAAIDRIWTATGNVEPINRYFLDDYIQTLYLSVLRQGQGFAVFAGLAVLLACLGLIGLSVSTAERRRKEIGIRKSMGANVSDVLALLTWDFVKPVLWANLIAWPVAYYAMNRWLTGFAYHIELQAWMFVAAGAVAVLIALATVSMQSWMVARAKPVTALRYE